jgi:hypothetical protein
LAPLLTERFDNDAATATGTIVNATGDGIAATGALATITFDYDATTDTYSITDGVISQTFGPSQLDITAQPGSLLTSYVRTSGGVTDRFMFTEPGTTGPFTYRYVSGAFWAHTTIGGSTSTTIYNTFAYGVETTNAAVPTTGTGHYEVDLLGTVFASDGAFALSGTGGDVDVNFASGGMLGSGTVFVLPPGGGAPLYSAPWTFTASIASGVNGFGGTFNFSGLVSGPVDGRFYGPGAEEIGGVFSSSGTDTFGDPLAVAGFMVGREGP